MGEVADGSGAEGMVVTVWGARGTMPMTGAEYQRYGGSTTCIEVRCGGRILIFDCGSGVIRASKRLKAEGVTSIDLLLTHSHYDHIIGFPFFGPLYNPLSHVTVWSGHLAGKMTTEEIIAGFMRPPWFPVEMNICAASLRFRDFVPPETLEFGPDIRVRTGRLNHPGGATGYRIEWAGRSFAIITDTEHVPGELDPAVLALIDDVDFFVYDTTFEDDELAHFRGYGHSTWQQAVRLAEAAGARGVGFIHHSHHRSDDELDRISESARRLFPAAHTFRDGETVII